MTSKINVCKIKAIPKSDVFYTSLTRLKDNINDLQEIL